MTYFFDENISHRHANMLRALREEVVHISKARGFRRSDPDTVWMPKVAAEGWIAVTLDVSIQRVAVERLVRAKSGLRVVFLAEGFRNKPFFEQAKFLVNHWDALKKATDQTGRVLSGHRSWTGRAHGVQGQVDARRRDPFGRSGVMSRCIARQRLRNGSPGQAVRATLYPRAVTSGSANGATFGQMT